MWSAAGAPEAVQESQGALEDLKYDTSGVCRRRTGFDGPPARSNKYTERSGERARIPINSQGRPDVRKGRRHRSERTARVKCARLRLTGPELPGTVDRKIGSANLSACCAETLRRWGRTTTGFEVFDVHRAVHGERDRRSWSSSSACAIQQCSPSANSEFILHALNAKNTRPKNTSHHCPSAVLFIQSHTI